MHANYQYDGEAKGVTSLKRDDTISVLITNYDYHTRLQRDNPLNLIDNFINDEYEVTVDSFYTHSSTLTVIPGNTKTIYPNMLAIVVPAIFGLAISIPSCSFISAVNATKNSRS